MLSFVSRIVSGHRRIGFDFPATEDAQYKKQRPPTPEPNEDDRRREASDDTSRE